MKTFLQILATVVGALIVIGCIVQLIFLGVGPDYKEGKYTMVYRIHYPSGAREYTITNNLPIGTDSYRGTNTLEKTVKSPIFYKAYRGEAVVRTSAPIEVVSYTFTNE